MKTIGWLACALALVPGLAWAECESAADEDCPALTLEAAYWGEGWRNSTGGIERGSAYLDRLDLIASFLGRRDTPLERVSAHLHVMHNNGRAFSDRYVGDLQVASNIEGVRTWRAYEAWAQIGFGDEARHSLRFGLYDLNTEFDALDSSALFLNSSHGIGAQIAQTGLNGPSIFPVTGLGLRSQIALGAGYAQFAVLDGAPGQRDDPDRTGFDLSSDEGALWVAEIGGPVGPFSKLALGAWGYTARVESIDEFDANGDPLRRRGNRGLYAIGEGTLYENGARSVAGFVRVGNAPERFNALDFYVGAGVVATGLLAARPDDQFGLAFAMARNGERVRRLAVSLGGELDRQETSVELTWRAPITEWLTLQPDIQYILNPGTDPGLEDALVFGLRFELTAGWSR